MGGQSSTTQQQQSVSQPWAPAQPALQGILGQVNGLTGQSGINPIEQSGLSALTANAQAGNPYAPAIGGVANNLLSGGGANAQAGNLSGALSQYQSGLQPFEQSSFLNPMNTPGFGAALSGLNNSITSQINGQFAAAGRDLSPANSQALATGLSQGEGQLIANQYNQNVQNQLGALGSGYNAANATGGLLSQLNQTGIANQQAGIGASQSALDAANQPGAQLLSLGQVQQGLPLAYLQALAGITTPIAGLGGQTNSSSSGTTNMSGVQQFNLLASGLGRLFGGSGGSGSTGYGT